MPSRVAFTRGFFRWGSRSQGGRTARGAVDSTTADGTSRVTGDDAAVERLDRGPRPVRVHPPPPRPGGV